jgi:hypothetical protein
MNIFFQKLSSKKCLAILISFWAITIIYAWWFVPPKVDDGIYLAPSLSVLNNFIPGVILGDALQPIFFIFPTQPFLHGIFLKSLELLSFDINIEIYRLFNYLLVIFLFYLTSKLFSIIFEKIYYQRIALNLSLILLGLSQFSLHFYVNRPEILGLVFFMLGLINFIKFIKISTNKKLSIFLAFIYFGLSSIVHPNLLFLSLSVFVYLVYYLIKTKNLTYLKFSFSFTLPFCSFLAWFFINIDAAKDQLLNRSSEVAANTYLNMPAVKNIFSTIIGDSNQSIVHNLYLQLHMGTFLLTIVLLTYFLFKKVDKNNKIFYEANFLKFFSISIFFLILIMAPYRPYFLLTSFLSIILLVLFLISHSSYSIANAPNQVRNNKIRLLSYVYLIAFLLPLSLPVFHLMKNYISNGNYDNHHKTIEMLSPYLDDNKHIFLTTGQLLPLFTDRISKDFQNIQKRKKEKVHWYFPIADTPGNNFKDLMRRDIKNDHTLMQGAIWGSLKKTTSTNDNITCLSLKGSKDYINLYNPIILFEDRQNIFMLSNQVIPSNQCLKNKLHD